MFRARCVSVNQKRNERITRTRIRNAFSPYIPAHMKFQIRYADVERRQWKGENWKEDGESASRIKKTALIPSNKYYFTGKQYFF